MVVTRSELKETLARIISLLRVPVLEPLKEPEAA